MLPRIFSSRLLSNTAVMSEEMNPGATAFTCTRAVLGCQPGALLIAFDGVLSDLFRSQIEVRFSTRLEVVRSFVPYKLTFDTETLVLSGMLTAVTDRNGLQNCCELIMGSSRNASSSEDRGAEASNDD